jgi:hypothetical protein
MGSMQLDKKKEAIGMPRIGLPNYKILFFTLTFTSNANLQF